MTLHQVIAKLKEMHQIEERLLAMLSDNTMILHEEDLKVITGKIIEVSSMILQLKNIIETAKRDHRGDNDYGE